MSVPDEQRKWDELKAALAPKGTGHGKGSRAEVDRVTRLIHALLTTAVGRELVRSKLMAGDIPKGPQFYKSLLSVSSDPAFSEVVPQDERRRLLSEAVSACQQWNKKCVEHWNLMVLYVRTGGTTAGVLIARAMRKLKDEHRQSHIRTALEQAEGWKALPLGQRAELTAMAAPHVGDQELVSQLRNLAVTYAEEAKTQPLKVSPKPAPVPPKPKEVAPHAQAAAIPPKPPAVNPPAASVAEAPAAPPPPAAVETVIAAEGVTPTAATEATAVSAAQPPATASTERSPAPGVEPSTSVEAVTPASPDAPPPSPARPVPAAADPQPAPPAVGPPAAPPAGTDDDMRRIVETMLEKLGLNGRVAALRQQVDRLQAENARLTDQARAAQAEADAARKVADAARQTADAARKAVDAAAAGRDRTDADVAALRRKVDALDGRLTEAADAARRLREEKAAAEAELSRARADAQQQARKSAAAEAALNSERAQAEEVAHRLSAERDHAVNEFKARAWDLLGPIAEGVRDGGPDEQFQTERERVLAGLLRQLRRALRDLDFPVP